MNNVTRKKCSKCGYILEIPEGDCAICFGDVLGELSDIEDSDDRYQALQDWITEFLQHEYERGFHNAVCENKYEYDVSYIEDEWVEIEIEENTWVEDGKIHRRQLRIPESCYLQI